MSVEFFGHSGVRIGDIAIDPGSMTSERIVDGARAVIITHIHADHVDLPRFREVFARRELEVFGPSELASLFDAHEIPFTTLSPGEQRSISGEEVTVFGGTHWPIYDSVPQVANLSLKIGGVLHPGDDFPAEVPGEVDTLLLPVAAPWLRLADAIDFAKRVNPTRTHPIHDAILSPQGKKIVDGVCLKTGVPGYERIEATP